jgi:hypothetical protein
MEQSSKLRSDHVKDGELVQQERKSTLTSSDRSQILERPSADVAHGFAKCDHTSRSDRGPKLSRSIFSLFKSNLDLSFLRST